MRQKMWSFIWDLARKDPNYKTLVRYGNYAYTVLALGFLAFVMYASARIIAPWL